MKWGGFGRGKLLTKPYKKSILISPKYYNDLEPREMKITMEADYAIRIVYCISRSGSRMDARSVSEEVNVTLRFALKILRKLVMSGAIVSYKGVGGGYALAKAPGDISLKDVIEAVDGPILINRCLGRGDCSRVSDKSRCPFHVQFARINEMLADELAKVNFASLDGEEGPGGQKAPKQG